MSPPKQFSGYLEKTEDGRWIISDWHGKEIAAAAVRNIRPVKPWQRGGWISPSIMTVYAVYEGAPYVGQGRGRGMSVNLRRIKRLPKGI